MLCVGGFDLIEGDHPKARIVGIGRVRKRDSQRPDRPSYEPLTRGCTGNSIGPFAALPRRLLIDIPREITQKRVFDDLLIERRVLPAAPLPRIFDKEFALRDAGCPEGIRLDDVRPCLEKSAMNIANHLWLGQREEVAVIQQALRRILKALPADVRFRHSISADSRAHRSIDDGNPTL